MSEFDSEDLEEKEETSEEVKDDRLYKDADIINHASVLLSNYLQKARENDFEVTVSFTDLKLIADSVALARTRTEQVNRIAETLNKRMELVRNHAQHLQNIASLKLTNEKD